MNTIALAERDFFPYVVDLQVETDEELRNANDLLAYGKKMWATLEAQRKADKQPHMDAARDVDTKFKPVLSRVELAIGRIDKAVLDYHHKKKAEADALLLIQAQEEAKKIAEAKETGEVYTPPAPIVHLVGDTVRGHLSTTNIRETYEYEIVDPNAVPRDLCSPDLQKIKARHKSGISDIPGVLITKREYTSTRAI
jgi:hypothetical protein